ncbi:apolipoprotein N-acyltransferase [Zwartia hollandica]|nr:apolipoprotein N-acyltransferase [Zwartia hollandica]
MRHFWLKWRLAFGLLAAGATQALTYAPEPLPSWSLSFVQFATMALLVAWVWRAPSPLHAARRAWLFGLAHFAVGLYWLTISMHVYGLMPLPIAIISLLALSGYLSLFIALAAWLTRRFGFDPTRAPNALSAPVWASLIWAAAWTFSEWLRANLFTGFPWLSSGYAHVDSWFAPWASLLGVYGVSFITAFVAAVIAGLIMKDPQKRVASQPSYAMAGVIALMIGLLGWGLGKINWTQPVGSPIALRLIQGNIEQGLKFTPAHLQEAIAQHLKLAQTPTPTNSPTPAAILLPETVLAVFQHQLAPSVWQAWIEVAKQQSATLLMGSALFNAQDRSYTNSVIGITPDTTVEQVQLAATGLRYDKHHLVPFGEFIPWGFRWFVDLMSIPMGDFHRGAKSQPPFLVKDQHIAANICYEDIFGDELLSAITQTPNTVSTISGATILANFSNLGWFGDSWALRQHWQMARMRSIETSRPMVRATNTGVTGAINQHGQVIATLPTHRSGVLDVSVQGQQGTTPYARVGDWASLLLSLAILSAALLMKARVDKRQHPTA